MIECRLALTFSNDFGASWVEAASRKEELRNREVAVTATGNVRTEYSVLLGYLWQGLLAHLVFWR